MRLLLRSRWLGLDSAASLRSACALTAATSRLHAAFKAATFSAHLIPLRTLSVGQQTLRGRIRGRIALTQTLHFGAHRCHTSFCLRAHLGALTFIRRTLRAHPRAHRVHRGTLRSHSALTFRKDHALDGVELRHLARREVERTAGVQHGRDAGAALRHSPLHGAWRAWHGAAHGSALRRARRLGRRFTADSNHKSCEGNQLRGRTHNEKLLSFG
jgi:hypothetical protein